MSHLDVGQSGTTHYKPILAALGGSEDGTNAAAAGCRTTIITNSRSQQVD